MLDPTSSPTFRLGARVGSLLGVAGMTLGGILAEALGFPWWLPAPVALAILFARAARAARAVVDTNREARP
jgi:hypothetical protein